MATWEGCGHEVKPVFFRDDVMSAILVIEFTENNPKKLCFDCWRKESSL